MNPATKRVHAVASALAGPLRDEGFRRTRLLFWREDEHHAQLLSLQPRTAGSTGSFTVELGVGFPAVAALAGLDTLWAAGRGIFAAPFRPGRPPVCTMTERLPKLMYGEDRWWSVTGRVDIDALAQEVLRAWHQHGVGWMTARSTLAKARAQARRTGNVLLCAVLELASARKDRAAALFESSTRRTPAMAAEIRRLARRNGIELV